MRALVAFAIALSGAGCYHYQFQQAPPVPPGARLVTHVERRPTYLNGFIGTGKIDTSRFCAEPVRTELRVTATDVLLSVATLLIYTPHTLSVTCIEGETRAAR